MSLFGFFRRKDQPPDDDLDPDEPIEIIAMPLAGMVYDQSKLRVVTRDGDAT
jgi:hypothetical protein